MDENEFSQEPSEPSEATLIVDASALRRAQQPGNDRTEPYLIVIAGPHTGKTYKLSGNEALLGRSPKCDFQLQDVGVSRSHARLYRVSEDVFVEDLQSANGTFLNGERLALNQQLRDGDKIALGSNTILKFTYHDALDQDYQKRMFEAALRDGLTNAYNKKFFLSHIESEFSYAMRHKTHLGLLMFDVDHFKNINDTYGHLAGDHILTKLSSLAMNTIRTEDVFARYGGEEFAVIARGSTMFQVYQLAERFRKEVETYQFIYNGAHIPLTISLGVASFPEIPVEQTFDLIEAADSALYRAKRGGRNRSEMGSP